MTGGAEPPKQSAALVTVHGRELPVVLNKTDERTKHKIVHVDVDKFDKAWQRGDHGFYIGPGGTGAVIGERYHRFSTFAKTAPSMEASDVHVDADGRAVFGNGRHRYSVLRDAGNKTIPVAMTAEAEANARRHGYLSSSPASSTSSRGATAVASEHPATVQRHRTVRGDPGEGPYTEVLMSDGAKHTIQRLDAASSMGLPGWHWTSAPKGAQGTYLADSRDVALQELANRHNKKG